MSTLVFLPSARATEPLPVGDVRIVPFRDAAASLTTFHNFAKPSRDGSEEARPWRDVLNRPLYRNLATALPDSELSRSENGAPAADPG